MIDRERWAEALKALACQEAGDDDGEAAGFHIPQLGSVVLHVEEPSASLMRIVCEESARDPEELTTRAQQLEDYASRQANHQARTGAGGGALPLYASSTPNGRLVANFCACSPFDETDEALEALDAFVKAPPFHDDRTQ